MTEERKIILDEHIARVPLTRGYFAIIDATDVPLVEGHIWTASPNRNVVYAMRRAFFGGRRRPVFLHRVILGVDNPSVQVDHIDLNGLNPSVQVDHIDLDGLNNRRANLRLCSKEENLRNKRTPRHNTSGFKGVSRQNGKWHAQIQVLGTKKHLGNFDTAEAAHAAYVAASVIHHGEFGRS
jgi:hypothetical protein